MPTVSVDKGSYEARWSAKEVVREIDSKAHVLLRLTVRGEPFAHRAMTPIMRFIDDERRVVDSWFTELTDEEDGIVGYFPVDATGEVLEYGYEEGGPLRRARLHFDAELVKRLDRSRLGDEVTEATIKYILAKQRSPDNG